MAVLVSLLRGDDMDALVEAVAAFARSRLVHPRRRSGGQLEREGHLHVYTCRRRRGHDGSTS